MKHENRVGIAFFYFSFTDESKQKDHDMLRALLLQLSAQLQDGEKELEQLHTLYKSRTPPLEALLNSLRSLLSRFRDSYILLDALDESPEGRHRDGVIGVIQVIRGWCLPSVHLFVTSRDLGDIRESLNPSGDCDISMKNSGIDKDIANFVSYQLDNDPKLHRWKALRSDIQSKLTMGAQGM
jgi:hypothetical protein